jgi:hypothetical protein
MRARIGIGGAVTLAALLAAPIAVLPEPARPDEITPPVPRPPIILAPSVPAVPPPGMGRLTLAFDGNRRWCTFPDDRVMKPPAHPAASAGRRGQRDRREIYTFGYQFVVAAVRRGAADAPIMLYESPVFRTASWRPLSKVQPQGPQKPSRTQMVAPEGKAPPRLVRPDTLVPYWHELNRCATLPERMEFDLQPGTYDVYVAFDLINREGGWVHRSAAFLTDVPVEAPGRTRVDGRVHMGGGSQREVELRTAVLEPPGATGAGATGP